MKFTLGFMPLYTMIFFSQMIITDFHRKIMLMEKIRNDNLNTKYWLLEKEENFLNTNFILRVKNLISSFHIVLNPKSEIPNSKL